VFLYCASLQSAEPGLKSSGRFVGVGVGVGVTPVLGGTVVPGLVAPIQFIDGGVQVGFTGVGTFGAVVVVEPDDVTLGFTGGFGAASAGPIEALTRLTARHAVTNIATAERNMLRLRPA
jgi:hypothetical protein